jgi:hypothetical protein
LLKHRYQQPFISFPDAETPLFKFFHFFPPPPFSHYFSLPKQLLPALVSTFFSVAETPFVITLNCTIPAYLTSGLFIPLPSQSHAEQFLKKPLKTSNPRPNFSLGAGIRLLSLYCTRVSAG